MRRYRRPLRYAPALIHSCPAVIGRLIALALGLAGCSATTVTVVQGSTPSATATATATPTATPLPPCQQLAPGSSPANGVPGIPGIQLPAGTYISAPTTGGGGTGQYSVKSYTLCFHGSESAIDGGPFNPPTSTIGHLVHNSGWVPNNLFPDPTSFAYLDYCSSGHTCVNTSGSPNPFTFAGFDQFGAHTGGYTTFRLQVGTISAPSCLNDPNYYSGTPKYTLYEDGSSASSSNPTYHFQMPPATRVSTYLGGGTAGSDYVYFCSAGTVASINSFLKQSMQNDGYTVTNTSGGCFTANKGTSPNLYSIQTCVSNPNNYYLRIFVPQ
jgi:hypothetical protein